MKTRQPDTKMDGAADVRPVAADLGPVAAGSARHARGARRSSGAPVGRARSRQRSRAFTLIELLIVLEVVMIMAGMALPNLKASRKQADEASAVLALRQLSDAQELYRPHQSPPMYADSLEQLKVAGLIDSNLGASHRRSGYWFVSSGGDNNTYAFSAYADVQGVTGDRSFYVDQTGVIRMAQDARVTAFSSPLQ